jgi:2-polyprenyl-3-methyl-5-hydroxy-6-metoxy-1,4-benzoquinol methylase
LVKNVPKNLHNRDAFGKSLLDFYKTGKETVTKVIRVEDGYEDDMLISQYFQLFEEWPTLDRALVQWMYGRILDVGVGGGRLARHMQDKGHDVVGIDISPSAVEAAKANGVRDVRLHNILEGPLEEEKFDTIVLLGNNLGIAGTHANIGPFLKTLASMLEPGGRIIGTQLNWERTDKPEHLKFQEDNRKAGKHPVEITLRIEYNIHSEDFAWCLVNQLELIEISSHIGLEPEAILDCREQYGYVLKVPEPIDS